MKIQHITPAKTEFAVRPEAAAERAQGATLFARTLTNLSQDAYVGYIQQSIQDISDQGELLGKRADLKELSLYRQMIKKLLDETVSNGYAFKKNTRQDARGRNKVYALIHKVNDELDEMVQSLLEEQADTLALLSAVDDIRGLLLEILI